jgi:hypothetical protein
VKRILAARQALPTIGAVLLLATPAFAPAARESVTMAAAPAAPSRDPGTNWLGWLDGLLASPMEARLAAMVKTCFDAGYAEARITEMARYAANSGSGPAMLESWTRNCRAEAVLATSLKNAKAKEMAGHSGAPAAASSAAEGAPAAAPASRRPGR